MVLWLVATGAEAANGGGDRGWSEPTVLVALVGVLVALVSVWVTHRIGQRNLRLQRELFEKQLRTERNQRQVEAAEQQVHAQQKEETDETRYLNWVIGQHRFLSIAGLRTREAVEMELEQVYVSLSVDPQALARLAAADGGEQAEGVK